METVMEDLQEVTRQYLSCADPIEAAARRQRVMYGDANGLMEETTARIILAASNQRGAIMIRGGDANNPNTPPPVHETSIQDLLFPDPSVLISPAGGDDKEKHIGLDPYYNDVTQPKPLTPPNRKKEKALILKSIVVSPISNLEETTGAHQEKQPQAEEEET